MEEIENKIQKLIEEAGRGIVPLRGNVGAFMWNPAVKKELDGQAIWQIQHANEHNPHELEGINIVDGQPADEDSVKKLNSFLTRYR